MCPRMYKLHYVDRLRPKGTTSALVFGNAIDEALNALLLKTGDPIKVFQKHFTWEDCKDVTWFDADYDPELFTKEQINKLTGKSTAYMSWACLRVKGRMLIEQYIEQIIPLIEEVHHVQLQTQRPGFIDAVVTLRKHGTVLIDHKTSSKFYKRDSVKASTQLALYAKQIGVTKAGFCVLSKNIRKNKLKRCKQCEHETTTSHRTCNNIRDGVRCGGDFDITIRPEAIIQLIIDDISITEQDIVLASITETEKAIKEKNFPMNATQCHNVFGKKCPYFNYCRYEDKSGLEKK